MPRIQLIEDLTETPLPTGCNLLVEYDPTSQWFAASLTMAAGWIRTGGSIAYITGAQPSEKIRSRLQRLGLAVEELEQTGKLEFFDYYSASLGQKSREKGSTDTLKVADLSIEFAKDLKIPRRSQDELRIWDNGSVLARFNDEKVWVEFELTRLMPRAIAFQSTRIMGLLTGVHSDWAYRQLELAADGVIDFKLDATSDPPRNLIRIRNIRDVSFDGRWHQLRVNKNFDVTLDQ
jgi:KaiC/GvpD/RAD55 family RecA-like ATPase